MRYFALLLLALFAMPLPAQQPAAREQPYGQGVLWKIERGAARPSYVFGTIHLADPRVTALPPPVRQGFDSSAAVAIETTLDAGNLLQAAGRMIYKDGRDLAAVAGPGLYEKVLAAAPALGIPPEMLRLFKPWAVALLFMQPPGDPQNVLDFQLQRMAVEQKKAVHALETLDEQIDIFDRMPERDQLALLDHAVGAREQMAAMLPRVISAYLARDLATLDRMSRDESGADPALRAASAALMPRLLFDRNVRLAQRAQPLIDAGAAFVAVGALHLHGERGVLAELARRGYRVSRIY